MGVDELPPVLKHIGQHPKKLKESVGKGFVIREMTVNALAQSGKTDMLYLE